VKALYSIMVVLTLVFNSFSQETPEIGKEENEITITIDGIENDSWMDRYFLVKRINFIPALKKYKDELGLTEEQLKAINLFYSKYYNKMVELARSIKEKEEELLSLVFNGGDAEKLRNLIVEIAKKKAELTVYNIKEVRTIQNALTKEQFEKLKNLLEKEII